MFNIFEIEIMSWWVNMWACRRDAKLSPGEITKGVAVNGEERYKTHPGCHQVEKSEMEKNWQRRLWRSSQRKKTAEVRAGKKGGTWAGERRRRADHWNNLEGFGDVSESMLAGSGRGRGSLSMWVMGQWAGWNWRSTYTQLLREFYNKEEYRKGSWGRAGRGMWIERGFLKQELE